MSLDTKKYLNRPPASRENYDKSENKLRIMDNAYRYEKGFLQELRFFPEEVFLEYASKLNWTQEKLDILVGEEKLIPAIVDIRKGKGCYIDAGFIFSERAIKEFHEFLEEVDKAYDFSEVI